MAKLKKTKLIIAIAILTLAFIGANDMKAQDNPYYPVGTPTPVYNWILNTSNCIDLNISSSVNRTEVFKVYKTESGVTTTIYDGQLNVEEGIQLEICPADAPTDIAVEVRSISPSQPAVMEFVEWRHTFTADMFMPQDIEDVLIPIKIGTIIGTTDDENQRPLIDWNVDTTFLKNCITDGLHYEFEFYGDTITHIEPISIELDTTNEKYKLNFDAHLISKDVFSDYILLKKEGDDIYIDTNEPQDDGEEHPHPIWVIVVAAIAALFLLTGDTEQKKKEPKTCSKCKQSPCKCK